jgi:hypothetical protein
MHTPWSIVPGGHIASHHVAHHVYALSDHDALILFPVRWILDQTANMTAVQGHGQIEALICEFLVAGSHGSTVLAPSVGAPLGWDEWATLDGPNHEGALVLAEQAFFVSGLRGE